MILLHECGYSFWLTWAQGALASGRAQGLHLNPFATARHPAGTRVDINSWIATAAHTRSTVLWDPLTHIATLPATTNWTIYDDWNLWGGPRGDLSSQRNRREHVNRCLDTQLRLNLQPLGPTVTVSDPTSRAARMAERLSERTLDRNGAAWLAIAGTPEFWAAGPTLDAHVATLHGLGATGYVLTVVRPNNTFPPRIDAGEVEGICRTAATLSQTATVIHAFSDLAGLPSIAAGAARISTGLALGQRRLDPRGFIARDGKGRLYSRMTFEGLMVTLRESESADLNNQDPALYRSLYAGRPPGDVRASFNHHLDVLSTAIADLHAAPNPQDRARRLRHRYRTASRNLRRVEQLVLLKRDTRRALRGLRGGLIAFAARSGWRP